VRFTPASTALGSDGLITTGVCRSARRHFRSGSGRFMAVVVASKYTPLQVTLHNTYYRA
jgi:hypothetical protein